MGLFYECQFGVQLNTTFQCFLFTVVLLSTLIFQIEISLFSFFMVYM